MNARLKQFLAAENISQSQFADTIKVVRASVSHVLSGRNNPGYDFIKAIMTAYPKLNIEWLMLGKGKMYKDNPTYTSEESSENRQIDHYPYGNLFDDDEEQYDYEGQSLHEQMTTEATDSSAASSNAPYKRKVIKIMVFFDDGTYQEMSY